MQSTDRPPASAQDHGGNIKEVRARYGLEAVVDFSASINPLGHPPGLFEHLEGMWSQVLHYPDRDSQGFRAAVASRFGLEAEAVVAGNGSADLIGLVLRALNPARLVLCPPDFSLYESLSPPEVTIARVPRREAKDFAPDLPHLAEELRSGDALLLSNPANPSGCEVSRTDMSALLARAAQVGAHLIVDEAFADFSPAISLLSRAGENSNLVVLRSMTKFYGIPGLRLGFLAAAPPLARRVADLQVPWSVNVLAQEAGIHCLRDPRWEGATLSCIERLRTRLAADLAALPGVRPLPSAANYLLVRLDPPAPGARGLYEAAARRGVLIRHCGSFGLGERYVRVAVRTQEENTLLLAAFQAASEAAMEPPTLSRRTLRALSEARP